MCRRAVQLFIVSESPTDVIEVLPDSPLRADVGRLLDEHLADMFVTSPPESVHALGHEALAAPGIRFFTARRDGVLLGCGALKELSATDGEVKSMRTATDARGQGVAALVLVRVLAQARELGLERVSLETGSEDYFAPARRLYARHGFVECGPFADYRLDPNSVYMTLEL